MNTYAQLLKEGKELLAKAGILEAELDAWYLMSDTFKMDRTKFLMERSRPQNIADDLLNGYRERLNRRARRIPLQHILGIQEFMGMEFFVNRHVLIPRQDTEILVEEVLKEEKKTVLDLCTGSGCIAISLAKLGVYLQVDASDISKEALEVAKKNAAKLDAKVRFYESNLFEKIDGKYDIIVSNPPYIARKVIEQLEPEVKDYEPYQALYAPNDGLYFYEEISKRAVNYLNPNGKLFYEIGYDQADEVSHILKKYRYNDIQVIPDLTGKNRVVIATKKEEL